MKPNAHVILKGLIGSQAYGLAGPDSDEDFGGVFAYPTKDILGLRSLDDSIVTKNPDTAMHEAKKFVTLAAKSNPTINEMLWLPEECYRECNRWGLELIEIREAFPTRRLVHAAYLGYALSQFKDLEKRGGTFGPDLAHRTEKHARHLLRLCDQGLELWRTGKITVRREDPLRYLDFGKRIAAGDLQHAKDTLKKAERDFEVHPCVLPTEPNFKAIEHWLLEVRWHYLDV